MTTRKDEWTLTADEMPPFDKPMMGQRETASVLVSDGTHLALAYALSYDGGPAKWRLVGQIFDDLPFAPLYWRDLPELPELPVQGTPVTAEEKRQVLYLALKDITNAASNGETYSPDELLGVFLPVLESTGPDPEQQ